MGALLGIMISGGHGWGWGPNEMLWLRVCLRYVQGGWKFQGLFQLLCIIQVHLSVLNTHPLIELVNGLGV